MTNSTKGKKQVWKFFYSNKMKHKKNRKKVTATVIFDKKIAMRYSKTSYYAAMAKEIKLLPNKEKEKMKYSTSRRLNITVSIEAYKEKTFKAGWEILEGIYKKRRLYYGRSGLLINLPKAKDLMSILTNPNFLLVCYRSIKANKGATTKAEYTPLKQQKDKNKDQRRFLSNEYGKPDGIGLETIYATVELLKKGKYPWGISRRIYIDKPGNPDVKRPITIPPFMDRVIQEGIRRILESIYEPIFESTNRSFGFRPNKGTHDAIYGLQTTRNWGLYTAIEGDIKSAYDKVNRQRLLEILGEEIHDRKFLKLIKQRLNYSFFDTEKRKYIREKEGIPQGGIDSPYLWNIYMHEFDKFIIAYMNTLVSQKNYTLREGRADTKQIASNNYTRISDKRNTLRKYIKKIRDEIKYGTCVCKKPQITFIKRITGLDYKQGDLPILQEILHRLIKQVKLSSHWIRRTRYGKAKRDYLRFYYTRYADDWIILGNYDKILAERIRQDVKDFLQNDLSATLSVEKTLITDMRRDPAHFLGFYLRIRSNSKFVKTTKSFKGIKKRILMKTNSQRIVVEPDKERLINRLYMKGYCNRNGFPIAMKWLIQLESFAIIERFNAVLRGLAIFYAEWVTYPSTVYRWLYIIRYCCYKTLAAKYNTNIRGIFNRFGIKTETESTIKVSVTNRFKNKSMKKDWILLTSRQAIDLGLSLNRKQKVGDIFEAIESKNYLEEEKYFTSKGRIPRVMDVDFLEKISWVTRRTRASLDLPCARCGSTDKVQMHHIKHVRKTPYDKIPDNKPWLKIMALKNRKQIPVCQKCHMSVIHAGTYIGPKMKVISPVLVPTQRGYDNRLLNIENYIKPGEEYFAKTLEEKGWREVKDE